MSKLIIRPETEDDYRNTETLTREAFWNVYRPGCMSTMCCTATGTTRPSCRSWTLSWCWTAR